MTCRAARRNIGKYVDGELGFFTHRLLRRHLAQCADCFEICEQREVLPQFVPEWPPIPVPAALRTRILLAASRAGGRSAWPSWKLGLDNLLRPLMVPAVGGVLSALILFGVLMSDLTFVRGNAADDIPLLYLTKAWISDPTMTDVPDFSVQEDITVEVLINKDGRVYSIRMLKLPLRPPEMNARLVSHIASVLLTTKFHPAMNFGRPVLGRVLVRFRPTTQVTVYG